MSRRWAILGCGYVGRRLAALLLGDGHEVLVTSRSEEGVTALQSVLPKANAQRYSLGDEIRDCSEYDVIVISCPPGATSPAPEQALAKQLVAGQRLVYLSTTGVYAAAGGATVSDTFALAPGSERAERRLRVEQALGEVFPASIALRVSGIYGPGRGVHMRMRRGDYRLIGDADTLVSRIYVDDLVSAIMLLGTAESIEAQSYVIGDEEPTTATDHARGIAQQLGLPMPPTVDPSEVSVAVRTMLGADRRIVPDGLHALGWRARYPSWREGLAQALRDEKSS